MVTTINITVTFTETVIVTGIAANNCWRRETTNSTANYTTGNNTDTLTFALHRIGQKTIQRILIIRSSSALTLSDNATTTIADTAKPTANAANLALYRHPAPPTHLAHNKDITIDTTTPPPSQDTTPPAVAERIL